LNVCFSLLGTLNAGGFSNTLPIFEGVEEDLLFKMSNTVRPKSRSDPKCINSNSNNNSKQCGYVLDYSDEMTLEEINSITDMHEEQKRQENRACKIHARGTCTEPAPSKGIQTGNSFMSDFTDYFESESEDLDGETSETCQIGPNVRVSRNVKFNNDFDESFSEGRLGEYTLSESCSQETLTTHNMSDLRRTCRHIVHGNTSMGSCGFSSQTESCDVDSQNTCGICMLPIGGNIRGYEEQHKCQNERRVNLQESTEWRYQPHGAKRAAEPPRRHEPYRRRRRLADTRSSSSQTGEESQRVNNEGNQAISHVKKERGNEATGHLDMKGGNEATGHLEKEERGCTLTFKGDKDTFQLSFTMSKGK